MVGEKNAVAQTSGRIKISANTGLAEASKLCEETMLQAASASPFLIYLNIYFSCKSHH